ncbi:MAG: ATP-binding protein, partial [Pseudanabaenaceae cyanobacterium bins.68]|nr:ATP-binding protein [Pseudanabaenaceae cyanobacterium bins.68]
GGGYSIGIRQAATNWQYRRYRVRLNGQISQLFNTDPKFDPRRRPWYQSASRTGQPSWSPVYVDSASQTLAITAIQPVYDRKGELQGVLGSDLFLSELQEFLISLKVGRTGSAFVINRQGDLISISSRGQITQANALIRAIASPNSLVGTASRFLLEQFGDWRKINRRHTFSFVTPTGRQFLQVIPFGDRQSLDWLMVVVVPAADFLPQIQTNTSITLLLCALTLAIALIVGIWIVRWLSHPILQLNQAAQQLSQGQWPTLPLSDRTQEISQLNQSFRQMAEKLSGSFSTLQNQNQLMERLNEALSESGLRLSQFLASVPVGILVCDPSGKIYYSNQILQTMFRVPSFPTHLTHLFDQIPCHLADQSSPYPIAQLPIFSALQGQTAMVEDLELRHPDQALYLQVWANPIYDSDNQVVYAIAAFIDITTRRQAAQVLENYSRTLEDQVDQRTQELSQALTALQTAQAELIKQEKMALLGQLLAGVAHEINNPLGAINSAVGHLDHFWQAQLLDLLQFATQQPEAQLQQLLALSQTALSDRSSLSSREQRQQRRSLSQRLQLAQVPNPDQVANQMIAIGLDAQAQFLPTTPPQRQILSQAYAIANLKASTDTIAIATERCRKIVFALKTYSHQQSQEQATTVDLHHTIDTVLNLYQSQIKQGVTIIRHYDPNISPLTAYGDQLTQVWTNLIHNSLQAMANQGSLEIFTQQLCQQVQIQITDSGPGIPIQLQAQIFEPFFTTKPAGEGSGLGLDIVRRVIENHQGTIELESIPGRTTFRITLPQTVLKAKS